MSTVEGKTFIVTGAAKGIGRGEAELLVASGAQVAFTDVDTENGEAVVKPLGDRAIFLRHDVSSPAGWEEVIAATKQRFGKIDGLVNNAGIYRPATLAETTEDIFDSQVAVNQKGTLLGMKYVSEELKATGGGAIVNTSSVCGIRGLAGCIAYNATKWAIRGLTQTAALELAPFAIRVNAVLPGLIETSLIGVNGPEVNEQLAARTPLKRIGQPRDVATLVRFLLSDDAAFVTGADFLADGGFTL